MTEFVFRPRAQQEVLEDRDWYEQKSPGLGLRFAKAVEAALHAAAAHSMAYMLIPGSSCRRILLKRFPYSLVFLVQPDSLVIVACFHHRRDPRLLCERVRSEA